MVNRETPLIERVPQRSKKGVYRIADGYVNFWFRFILPHRSLLESGNAALVYQQLITPHFSTYMGHVFEDVCRQYVLRYWDEKLKVAPKQVGAHWERDFDIDVLTENVDGSHFFGECKWWDAPVGENVLDGLIQNTEKLPERFRRNARYVLFSLGGFTDALKRRAEREGVFLISADEMF